MSEKISFTLTKVPETLILPLRARYKESKRKKGMIYDPKSIEILDQIDYSFKENKDISEMSRYGIASRTIILDEQTNLFLSQHPDGVVINIGCGLDTRQHRLDNGQVTWYDLDLPEAIELRKHFFKEHERYKMIAQSALDYSWIDQIEKGRPTLILSEGLFMYFTEEQVKDLLSEIQKAFPGADLVFEAASLAMIRMRNKHPDLKDREVQLDFGVDSGKDMEKWGMGITAIADYPYNRNTKRMPLWVALIYNTIAKNSMHIIHVKL